MWCDTFCSTEGRLLAKYLTMWQRLGSAVSLYLSALCRCRSIPTSRHFLQSEAHVFNKRTKDRKKGCAYDPGALMIQGALQNQTLWYVTLPGKIDHFLYFEILVLR